MNIPETAYDAAAESITQDDPRISPSDACDLAANALEAALPAIEAALRKQIAAEIRLGINEYSGQLIEQAARIAEKGNTK